MRIAFTYPKPPQNREDLMPFEQFTLREICQSSPVSVYHLRENLQKELREQLSGRELELRDVNLAADRLYIWGLVSIEVGSNNRVVSITDLGREWVTK
jgi:hypothetical protein